MCGFANLELVAQAGRYSNQLDGLDELLMPA
jgi:hypothetical protein